MQISQVLWVCFFMKVFEITLSRGYNESNFRDDLKTLYLKLGIENKKTVFLFTDAHVAEEGFLELINNMLTSGLSSLTPHFFFFFLIAFSQPLLTRLLREPLLSVEVRPTISNQNFSTLRASSGSFYTREVMFHVPRAS